MALPYLSKEEIEKILNAKDQKITQIFKDLLS